MPSFPSQFNAMPILPIRSRETPLCAVMHGHISSRCTPLCPVPFHRVPSGTVPYAGPFSFRRYPSSPVLSHHRPNPPACLACPIPSYPVTLSTIPTPSIPQDLVSFRPCALYPILFCAISAHLIRPAPTPTVSSAPSLLSSSFQSNSHSFRLVRAFSRASPSHFISFRRILPLSSRSVSFHSVTTCIAPSQIFSSRFVLLHPIPSHRVPSHTYRFLPLPSSPVPSGPFPLSSVRYFSIHPPLLRSRPEPLGPSLLSGRAQSRFCSCFIPSSPILLHFALCSPVFFRPVPSHLSSPTLPSSVASSSGPIRRVPLPSVSSFSIE